MAEKIILTPACEMTWASRRQKEAGHSIYSPNEEKRFAIYTHYRL